MSVTDNDIRDYREHNSLADDIAYFRRVKVGISSNEYGRIAQLNEAIAVKESRMKLIASQLSDKLGLAWASRCVEKITRAPGCVSILVESLEFCDKSKQIGIDDINGVKFIVGTECFEIRKIKKGEIK